MTVLLLAIALSSAATPTELHARPAGADRPVPSNLIVGRAVCAQATWLLTDRPDLIVMTHSTRAIAVRPVKGLQSADKPWGLACLTDGSLWTLATSRALVRLSPQGQARERLDLPAPRLVMFGWIDRLLFIQLPMPIARPLLATNPPRATSTPTPWPRFFARASESRIELLTHNLVNCGIGYGRRLPCWFADERRAIVSDGAEATPVSFSELYARDVATSAPIWDLAMGSAKTLWLLVGTGGTGGRAVTGGRLVKADGAGNELTSLALAPAARTILMATDTTCLLLTVTGALLEVTSR